MSRRVYRPGYSEPSGTEVNDTYHHINNCPSCQRYGVTTAVTEARWNPYAYNAAMSAHLSSVLSTGDNTPLPVGFYFVGDADLFDWDQRTANEVVEAASDAETPGTIGADHPGSPAVPTRDAPSLVRRGPDVAISFVDESTACFVDEDTPTAEQTPESCEITSAPPIRRYLGTRDDAEQAVREMLTGDVDATTLAEIALAYAQLSWYDTDRWGTCGNLAGFLRYGETAPESLREQAQLAYRHGDLFAANILFALVRLEIRVVRRIALGWFETPDGEGENPDRAMPARPPVRTRRAR